MNLRHTLTDLRWWYRTAFTQWYEGPAYADCPDCDGQVYHYQGGRSRSVIKYQCRDCSWSDFGTTEFDFYQEQATKPAAWDVLKAYMRIFDDECPGGDLDNKKAWLENGGADIVFDRLAEEYDPDDFRRALSDLERVNADG